uniref:AAA domain-containing protein n=1 Tax=Caenorhabditis tropicalis TaxID=1561998 RepID=A0A1I7T2Y1_9PELO
MFFPYDGHNRAGPGRRHFVPGPARALKITARPGPARNIAKVFIITPNGKLFLFECLLIIMCNVSLVFSREISIARQQAVLHAQSNEHTLRSYFKTKVDETQQKVRSKQTNVLRLQAQKNELNGKVRQLKDEINKLHEQASYVGEVCKPMDKKKVLVKNHPDGKYIVNVDQSIDISTLTAGTRVALRADTYEIHKVLPSKVDPLVSLMMVEKVPDSTYEMVGGLDKQIKEIKEVIELPVKHPELFEALGIAQPKGVLLYGPPGTGKTLLARAVAHHTECTFIRVSGSELVQKFIGEGARMVSVVFLSFTTALCQTPPTSYSDGRRA